MHVDKAAAPARPPLPWDPDDNEAPEWDEKLAKPSQFNELVIYNTGWSDLEDGA